MSAILPTRGRQMLAKKALRCFLDQDYPHKEIVIIDDEEEPSFPAIITSQAWYLLSRERRIGAKRNMACHLAHGEIIVHFDSDDWSDPHRVTDQVERLEASGKQVTGYHSMFFYEEKTERAAQYKGDGSYALGTSLCYYRNYWQEHQFRDELVIHEDNHFVAHARDVNQLISVDAGPMMVARIHSNNTDPKHIEKFKAVELCELPKAFFQ